jgi:two-component system, OmpR family, response regulator
MRILLVEDEVKLGNAIKRGLEQEGYAVDLTRDAEAGTLYAETETYDLMLFDRMLPGKQDGLDICRQLRKAGNNTPVLILTARGEIEDRVSGLDQGADDYLTKPFDFDELLARIRALLRRPVTTVRPIISLQDLVIDTSNRTVTKSGIPARLSKREYALLEYFVHYPGQILSKDRIIEHVWDFDADILPNTVEAFVKSLRKKIDSPGQDSLIETVRGFGYRLKDTANV